MQDGPVERKVLPRDNAYRIGSDGTIQSCLIRKYKKLNGRGSVYYDVSEKWWDMKVGISPHGYRIVKLRGRRYTRLSRLVLETFVGPCPPGMEACHNDGNKENDNLSNLRWDTRKNNERDKLRHGTYMIRGKPPEALTPAMKDEAARLLAAGKTLREIATIMGTCHQVISKNLKKMGIPVPKPGCPKRRKKIEGFGL